MNKQSDASSYTFRNYVILADIQTYKMQFNQIKAQL